MVLWNYTQQEARPDYGLMNETYLAITLIRTTDSKVVTVLVKKQGITVQKIKDAVTAKLAEEHIVETIDI